MMHMDTHTHTHTHTPLFSPRRAPAQPWRPRRAPPPPPCVTSPPAFFGLVWFGFFFLAQKKSTSQSQTKGRPTKRRRVRLTERSEKATVFVELYSLTLAFFSSLSALLFSSLFLNLMMRAHGQHHKYARAGGIGERDMRENSFFWGSDIGYWYPYHDNEKLSVSCSAHGSSLEHFKKT